MAAEKLDYEQTYDFDDVKQELEAIDKRMLLKKRYLI